MLALSTVALDRTQRNDGNAKGGRLDLYKHIDRTFRHAYVWFYIKPLNATLSPSCLCVCVCVNTRVLGVSLNTLSTGL